MQKFYLTKVLRDSWILSFHNPILWLVGIFIISFFSTMLPSFYRYVIDTADYYRILDNVFINTNSLILLLIGALLIIVAFFAFSLITHAGIIVGIDKKKLGRKVKFWEMIKAGAKYFFRILALEFLFLVCYLLVFALFFIPLSVALVKELNTVSVILGLVAFLVAMILFMLIGFTKNYIIRYIILKNQTVIQAVKSGLKLFKSFWQATFLVMLIKISLSIGFSLLYFIAVLIIGAPFVLLGLVMSTLFSSVFMVIFLLVAGLVMLAVFFLIKGFIQTFYNCLWSFTFYQLEK